MSPGRDALFQKLFGREPTGEELRRFDRLGDLMHLTDDDSMWYVVLVNELYDDRLQKRLSELDRTVETRVTDVAVKRALAALSAAVCEKAEVLAAQSTQKNRGELWRSWGFLIGAVTVLCATVLNAGIVMAGGRIPFWLAPGDAPERIASWLFDVPSGWIFLLAASPFLLEVAGASLRKLRAGAGMREAFLLAARAIGAGAVLLFALWGVLF